MHRLAWFLLVLIAPWLRSPGAEAAEATEDLHVLLPAGETLLQDIGIYRVGWQSYGGQPVAMPLAWTGHFDAQTGISYQPWNRVLGRQTLLIHSPWHVPPGKVWVDYDLVLPHATPIWLTFGITMGPDVAAPDKSDGVTFSCSLVVDGQRQELMHQHHDQGQWIDFRFDLSPHAGQAVQLRLQVEPGPQKNASFDYSYFGDAKIVVGEALQNRSEMTKLLTDSRAYQATCSKSRTALSNSSTSGILPSNLLPCENRLEKRDDTWQFTYEGDDGRVVYVFRAATGTLDDFTVQVDEGRPFQPARGGTATAVRRRKAPTTVEGTETDVSAEESIELRGGRLMEAKQEDDQLRVLWEYDLHGRPLCIDWTFGIRGKALHVTARCDDPVVSAFSLGAIGLVPLRKTIPIPYLAGDIHYLPVEQVFVSRYLDWTQSHSSRCPQGEATYEPTTTGSRNPLFETGYIALSRDIGEVLPNIPHPRSPYLAALGPRIMLDIWGHHRGTYAGDAENLRLLKDLGVDHVAIIQHVWQRFGYDVKLPDHLPADPRFGGEEQMKLFGETANAGGYLWSLHENYIDLYPDAPSYDASARVLRADGTPSPAWYNAGTGVQSFGLKCNRALDFARNNSPEIHRRYATTAAYLDVHTCVPPWHQLDHEANQPRAAMALAKMHYDSQLFQFERDTHQGPLLGEGAHHFYWAGLCDGVEAQVAGGEDHTPLLDFDLLKIHPQMVNHGMGYYERWFRSGYQHRLGEETGTMEQIDKYRAMELAYGHAGFVGSPHDHNWHWVVREHHLMHPVQRLYATANVTEILYEVDGQLVTASVALAIADTSRQRIRYDSGLTLWVNWRPEPWQVEGRVLPQWGFLALGPQTHVSTTLKEGRFADYAECPEFVFADARTFFHMPYRREPTQIEPRLRDFQYLGGNRVRVTYEWLVGESPDRDYQCFVHAVNPGAANSPDHIVFQQDHRLPKPTGQWRPDDVIVDGPYEIAVSDQFDAYDLTIGLFRDERLRLKGLRDTRNRTVIARLNLERDAGKIVGVTATTPSSALLPSGAANADFSAHLNAAGTWIDFGQVATDGSVKINKQMDRLVVFPYPRDQVFRALLDLQQLAPAARADRIRVRMLSCGDQRDLGAASFSFEEGRLRLDFGNPNVGQYLVTWE
ncbi:MAG: glycoside hydrolase family protein [Pirellulaceae bacterium]